MKNNGYKRILTLILSFLCILICVSLTDIKADAKKIGTTLKNPGASGYSYIYFGSYPQNEVTDKEITDKIDEQLGENGGDCWVDGVKYRKLSKSEQNIPQNYRWYDTYSNWKSDSDYRYFKWERIKWRVLNVNTTDNALLVMADKGMDCICYNDKENEVTWETSTIRSWLNGYDGTHNVEETDYSDYRTGFYNTAFSLKEQDEIYVSDVINENCGNPKSTDGGNNTKDKIFLLSYKDVINPSYGFSSDCCAKDSRRQLYCTDYSFVRGAYTHHEDIDNRVIWMLRSPGRNSDYNLIVENDGICATQNVMTDEYYYCASEVDHYANSFAPVMTIKLDASYVLTNDGSSGEGGEKSRIKYELNGGVNNSANPERYKLGVGISSFGEPVKNGCTFEGWFSDSEFKNEISSIPADSVGDFTLYAKWKEQYSYIWFGSYPQSEVTDDEVIEKIDAKIGAQSGDCWVDGIKYRKVQRADSNSDEYWNETTAYRYFKWERIRWRVLDEDKEAGKLFVMADRGLDCKSYDDSTQYDTWETSTIRSWLNGYDKEKNSANKDYSQRGKGFLNTAFSKDEQAVIQNGDANAYSPDMIFLLSTGEALETKYSFSDDDLGNDTARRLICSDYSNAMGTKRSDPEFIPEGKPRLVGGPEPIMI